MSTILHKEHSGLYVKAHDDTSELEGFDGDRKGHVYEVDFGSNRAEGVDEGVFISFQNGPVPANGVNGLTTESLLAILIHRTKHLNELFHSDENDSAIRHMQDALCNLEVRTARRTARGVEGKYLA